jgi:hypothetical protein
MLLAKINPAAEKVIQVTPFSSTTIYLDYMTAIARPYVAGATQTSFELEFGKINEFTGLDNVIVQSFQSIVQTNLTLTSEELSSWGTNDEVLLSIIAGNLNVSVESYINVNGNTI